MPRVIGVFPLPRMSFPAARDASRIVVLAAVLCGTRPSRGQPHAVLGMQLDMMRLRARIAETWNAAPVPGATTPRSGRHWPLVGMTMSEAWVGTPPPLAPVVRPSGRFDPAVVDFGTVRVGETAVLTVTLHNQGRTPFLARLRTRCAEFVVEAAVEGYGSAVWLPRGGWIVLRVRFTPRGTGARRCRIPVGRGAGLTCAGFGVVAGTACEVTPGRLRFGSVLPEVRASRSVIVTNVGDVPLRGGVCGGGDGFELPDARALDLAPGESASVEVAFTPPAPGPYECDLVVAAPGCGAILCTGVGSDAYERLEEADRPDSAAVCTLGPCRPNPSDGRVVIDLDLPEETGVRLEIFDVAGRRVRTLFRGELAADRHSLAWDGRDDAGRLVPAGTYGFALVTARRTVMRKLQVVR